VAEPEAAAPQPAAAAAHWPATRLIRDYVTNALSRPLDKATKAVFGKLHAAQVKLRRTQPLKYKKNLRYVLGLRETVRGISVKRIRLVVLAPDVEAVKCAGGLDDTIRGIIECCQEHGVPFYFALSRQSIAHAFLQFSNKVSCVGVYNADGAYDEMRAAVALANAAKAEYIDICRAAAAGDDSSGAAVTAATETSDIE
jgi:ribosomal protein L7Ae-like RNA K-turn-binding protein